MVTSQQAIEQAFHYLKGLPPEYLEAPSHPRLETIQRFGDEWIVVISYLTSLGEKQGSSLNPLLKALTVQRRFKEFEIKADTGEVVALRDPREGEDLAQRIHAS